MNQLEHDDGAIRRAAKHVTWPGLLSRERSDEVVTLFHPAHGSSLDIEPESRELVDRVLRGFSEATTVLDFCAKHPEVPEELVVYLVRSLFVVEVSELPFLEHGFLRPTPAPLGTLWSWSDLPELARPDVWCVLGVPVDMGALGASGARHGPGEIRKMVSQGIFSVEGEVLDHELKRRYPAPRPPLIDLGDVDPEGSRMDHVASRLGKVLKDVLGYGMRPMILGGDHSLTHYVLRELIEVVPRFGIIHFDAHADMGPSRTLTHANVFEEALASDAVVSITQVGLRVMQHVSTFATARTAAKRTMLSARDARSGLALQTLEQLPRDIPYYLTFDIDCIDASIVRETGTPAFGGLSVETAVDLVDFVARTFHLLGADFVEVSAAQAGINAAASVAASLIERCLLGGCAFEPLRSDVYAFER